MTLAKRFLLGSAAALVATTGAQAADLGLPVAPAVDYVQICSIGSFTGFILPGSDVCFDISGHARFQVDMNEEGSNNLLPGAGGNDDYDMSGEAVINVDARTLTEFGLLRAFATIGSDTFEDDDEPAEFEKAFIQFGGLTAGVTDSFFDPVFTGEAMGTASGAGMAGDVDHALIAYTAAFGNGFTATLSLENDDARQPGAGNGYVVPAGVFGLLAPVTIGAYDESETMPDVVVSLRVNQAWGEARLNAALHEVDPAAAASDSEFGYAIGASAKFNVPFGHTSTIGFMGTYTSGATSYTGIDNNVAGLGMPLIDYTPSTTPNNIELTTAWVVGAGFEYGITEMLDLEVDGFYGAVDHDEAFLGAGVADADYDVYSIRGSLAYRPVAGLEIRAGVDYIALDGASNTAAVPGIIGVNQDDDEFAGRLRVTRSF
jgi:hypothetical protein